MRVGIIGTGLMGKGIVQILCQSASIETVIWKGSNRSKTELAMADIRKAIERFSRRNNVDASEVANWLSKITLANDYQDLVNLDMVIEAVSENIDIKESVFVEIAKLNLTNCIVSTNTSSLSVTHFSRLFVNPENFVGIHFFNPPSLMSLVEITAGMDTSETTVNRAITFAKSLGKEPVLVNESPGFIVNRMLIPMINEAVAILSEGVASAEDIDKAMKLGANHPIGPLALADLIGNDICLSIMETLHNETGDPKYRANPLLRKMVRANRLGRKSGVGFFKYK